MDEQPKLGQYRSLGKSLKELRTRAHESLAEVSGAVEIDVKQLAGYELGHDKPAEEILLLLLSHFGAKDDEALNLWELAGYNMDKIPVAHQANVDADQSSSKKDNRILFTDVVDVVVNNYGVVMNFMQNSGKGEEPTSVAKVGMSREHAKSVLKILQLTLAQTEHTPSRNRKLSAPTGDEKPSN